MKPVVFHDEAREEARAAAAWYEAERLHLGTEFREEVEAAVSRVARSPETFGFLMANIRCHRLHRFPFAVVYRIEPARIFVVAVMHLHRDPDYWKHRA